MSKQKIGLNKYLIVSLIIIVAFSSGCVQSNLPNSQSSDTQINIDSDSDGWTDVQEQNAGTNPYNKDTDGDGYWDSKDDNPLDKNIPASQVRPTTYETYQPTPYPTPYYTPTKQPQGLTSVIGKIVILKNIKENGKPSSTPMVEFKFGTDYIMVGKDFSEAKITEERTPTSLIVKATIVEGGREGLLTWRIEDDGTLIYTLQIEGVDVSSNSYIIGDWSIE